MVSPDLAKSIVEPWLYALNTGDAEQLLALSKDTEEIRSVWLEKCDSASVKSYGEKRPCGSSSDGGVKKRFLALQDFQPTRLFVGSTSLVIHYKTVDRCHAGQKFAGIRGY